MSMYSPFFDPVHYSIEKRKLLRFSFPGIESVQINYSQLHQDMFVLAALQGKRHGLYLEIGGNEPILNSNSFLLEDVFRWRGVSLEISAEHVSRFNALRLNPCVRADATLVDYDEILTSGGFPQIIDYLSLDCEPPSNTFKALLRIPHERFRFRVISFEHDYSSACSTNSAQEMSVREQSRDFLANLGYRLAVNDVSWLGRAVEDWWVDPHQVPEEDIRRLLSAGKTPNDHVEYMYGAIP